MADAYKTGSVTGTNIAAGNNFEYLGFTEFDHFSVLTGTLTNMTVTIEASNDDSNFIDVTSDLFGVASLSSSTEYVADTVMTYKDVRIKYARTNAANAVNFQWMKKKGGGR